MSCIALPGASWGQLVVAQREEPAPRCLRPGASSLRSEGLVAGGLLSDPPRVGQRPQLSLQTGTQAAARAVRSGQRFTDAPVAAQSLARCRAVGMSNTWSLVRGSSGDGCVGARAEGLTPLVRGRWWEGWWGQFWGQVAQAEKQDRQFPQKRGSGPLPTSPRSLHD